MADSPFNPKDDGHIGLPSLGPGMNKRAPDSVRASNADQKTERLGVDRTEDEEILERVRKRFDRCLKHEADNRKRMTAALHFKSGKQWSDAEATQRNIDQRPCLTINRLPTFIRQVTNDQRMNRPAINISPVGSRGDPEAAKDFGGLIRAIERESSADIAYDTGFENAVSIGIGYWRIVTEWESEESFHQVLAVKRVRNSFTVYRDPDSQEPDGADWRYAFVTEIVPEDEFKDRWPKAQVTNFDLGGQGEKFKSWVTKDGIRIAEYFEVTKEPRTLVLLDNGHEGWKDELDEVTLRRIEKNPEAILEERESYDRKIRWYKVTAVEILEREDWLGKWIPIVPVIGNEIDIDGEVKLSGLIEPAMDPQRMYNYYRTKEAEAVALAPNAPYLMAEGQAEGHEDEWRNANRTANPVLFYKPEALNGHPLPPPQRLTPPGIPEGFVHGAEGAAQDIMATTGIRFDVMADHRNVDDRSGKAIREFNRPQDLGASHYLDNLKRSLIHTGRIFVDLIPKVYDEKRQLVILREDDSEQKLQIDPNASQAHQEVMGRDGKKLPTFNPTIGKYGVTVTVGPSYATRRAEAADAMMEFGKSFPHAAPIIMDLVAKNQDWEGADEMAARLAKAIPAQLLTPEQKDVPPQMQAYIQNLETQIKQLGSQLQASIAALNDKGADRAIAQDKIDKDFEAKLIKIISDAEAKGAQLALDKVETAVKALETGHRLAQPPQQPQSGGEPANA